MKWFFFSDWIEEKTTPAQLIYIHNCLKNGETPIPGPVDGAPQREDAGGEDQAVGGQPTYFDQPAEVGGWSQPVPAPRKPVQQTFSETQLPAGKKMISKT